MFPRKHKEDKWSKCDLELIKLVYLANKLRPLEPPGRLSQFLILFSGKGTAPNDRSDVFDNDSWSAQLKQW